MKLLTSKLGQFMCVLSKSPTRPLLGTLVALPGNKGFHVRVSHLQPGGELVPLQEVLMYNKLWASMVEVLQETMDACASRGAKP